MKSVKLRQFTDHRGSLAENTLEKIMLESRHFFVSKSKPGTVRGNHYHKHKSEWFLVIKGECKLCLEDVVTKTGEERAITEKDNVLVHIGPNVAHVFVNTGSSELILLAFVNEVLDHQNPDTYEYKINL
ncbi:hypothetical protein A2313_04465 [Candidatus Roizmanbacteria bacterium RIFOXYB2_FULL_41_10]|uniref:Capsular polysaccharide assembling protein CapF C-terminal domain-containing protein n=1 Tax=Candidatus Roizmanbacteria bacterium RIFOXYA1_FULL_41_12 TaxID=1802082 RepID=A0A1F7K267_9BACT|nr:MAG: hypothetical protein A2209_04970 [Candidatus Roizmanbacteria bacterium RIFOXYA1_FULL_41_12]OGK66234.1 MAG: hypothetical protein A2262_02295 [Candidatus Roizmanbacteria bacterium RIFOXYA2_FULL_41_8]OGK66908.1 MAG: hypothetical protein A2377_03350 [Candidatus Roizmanbacteria bacterium RIFOXYB1_FULL_41_27]OGK70719.1 MAG: hypothetical protein A2403_01355 [Candidatus Roizmanbacteria bacterium RIFOXYC1_FULL_41_16]OGK71581.1 MAG: hypothetical protein A2313_04465 [Candidatus Roizmanbacteria bac